MLFDDVYKTISNFPESNITENGSRFIAFAFNTANEKEMKKHIENLKLKYPDATHHCYACVLHPDKSFVKITDDGEPSGTAGRPLLIQLNKRNLTNILIVVVRYFGGKKLGIPGLIDAYSKAASICLDNAIIIDKKIMEYYRITAPASKHFEIYNIAKKYKATIVEIINDENLNSIIAIDKTVSEKLINECNLMTNFVIKYLKTE